MANLKEMAGKAKAFLPANGKQWIGTGIIAAGTTGLTLTAKAIGSKVKSRKKTK